MTRDPAFDVVIPTIGRPSLRMTLEALAAQEQDLPGRVLIVDDRRNPTEPLSQAGALPDSRVEVVAGPAAGPAAARNVGWRAATSEWVAFLDDDVVPAPGWAAALVADLRDLDDDIGGSQGRIRVPLPQDRPPTDWERNVAGLEEARWATADMAYRRTLLGLVNGFDERFPRAYREDAELGIRIAAAGYRIVPGDRHVSHPVRPADRWVSVRLQRGNADDALMLALHGHRWREAAGVARGRRARHAAIVAAEIGAIAGLLTGNRPLAVIGGAGWLAGTAEFAWARIGPGPRSRREVVTVLVTSIALPTAAVLHWMRGTIGAWGERPLPSTEDARLQRPYRLRV